MESTIQHNNLESYLQPDVVVENVREPNPPSAEVESKGPKVVDELIKIWEGVFEHQVSAGDNFFQLGGDSIKAMELISKINRKFGILLQIEEIFEDGSLAYQLDRIQNKSSYTGRSLKPAPVQDKYPLSNTQRNFFTVSQFDPDGVTCNVPIIYKVYNDLDIDKSNESIKEVIRRHHVLRTSYYIDGAKVVQEVVDDVDFDIITIDRKGRSIRQLLEEYIKPYDLKKPPLFRVYAIRMEGIVKLLIIDSHHSVSDLISLHNFTREMLALNRGESLEPLPVQYKDFAYWQQHKMPEVSQKQQGFWMDTFAKVPPKINLPMDVDQSSQGKFYGDTYKFEFEGFEIFKMRELCKRENISQFTFIMSLFYVFLHKISNQDDLVVGISSHGRHYPEVHKLVGAFVNTLPIRMKVAPGLSFSSFVQQFKVQIPKYFANQDYSYDLVLQNLRAKNVIQHQGLFNVFFEHFIIDWYDPKLNLVDRPSLVPKTDFAMFVGNKVASDLGREEVLFFVEYNKNKFSLDTIEMLAKYFSVLVDEVIQDIDMEIAELKSFADFKNGPHQEVKKYHLIDPRHDL